MKPKSKGKNKAKDRWDNGVWLGIRHESSEYIVGTPQGTIKVSAVTRKGSTEDRWNWDEFSKL